MAPTPEQWRVIEALFLAASELPEEQRRAYLARECDDAATRAEVERLLAHQPTSASFLEPPGLEAVSACLASSAGLIGERLGDFVIEERIGSGGMGVVFRARQIGLDRAVAVKVLEPSVRADPLSAERFRREARAASRLEHPGIAPVIAFGDHGALSYYAMQLVDGWSLRELMDGAVEGAPDPADPSFAARLVREVADALHYAHGQGVIHRDVKPQNLLVTREGLAPRLIDFGIAKVLALDTLSRTGDTAGTPVYMSPEQIRAEAEAVDHRTDIYSAGAVLYEMLAGAPPFEGANVQQLLYRITHERPRPIRALRPTVPRALELVALKALRRDRDDRYESARELRDDLDRFLSGAPVVARPPSPRERLKDLAARPRVWVPAGSTLVAAALFAGWWWGAPTPPSGRLSVALPAGVAAATADLQRVDPFTDAVTSVKTGVELPIDGRLLEPGWYRILVRATDGRVGESECQLDTDDSNRVEPVVRRAEEVVQDMIRIPAGTYTVGLRGYHKGSYGESRRTLAAFWIDRTEVSCRRYREFLASHPDVDPPWKEYDEAWDELPVIGVTLPDARRFAEWRGKRLPTWTEWQVAARGTESLIFPWGDEPLEIVELAVVGRPAGDPWYAHVRPVDAETGDRSPFGVLNMFGNVQEWTSSPRLDDGAGSVVPHPSWRVIQGFNWDSTVVGKDGSTIMNLQMVLGMIPANWTSAGLRCARTASD